MAAVRIDGIAFSDPRIDLLGEIAGYNSFEALGRLARLWSACTERETDIVPDEFIAGTLGKKGVEALIQSGLGERITGGCRVKGCKGRTEWLGGKRRASKAGGEATRDKFEGQRGPEAGQRQAETGPEAGPLTLTLPLTLTPTLVPTKEKEPPTPKPIIPESIPPEIDTKAFRELWSDWKAHRAEIKHPLTKTSTKQQLAKLAAMGESRATAALRHSIANGWQGIFEPDKRANQKSAVESTAERLQAFIDAEGKE